MARDRSLFGQYRSPEAQPFPVRSRAKTGDLQKLIELIAQAESVQETTTMQTGLDCVALALQTQFCRRTLR